MILSIVAAALAAQLTVAPEAAVASVLPQPQPVQYYVRPHPPPCGNGWDLSARDGLCYPNGFLPPQDQAALQYQRYQRGGRYPVRCGNGADQDSRDGLCYPTGTVPRQFQEGRQGYSDEGYYRRPPRGRYYYQD